MGGLATQLLGERQFSRHPKKPIILYTLYMMESLIGLAVGFVKNNRVKLIVKKHLL